MVNYDGLKKVFWNINFRIWIECNESKRKGETKKTIVLYLCDFNRDIRTDIVEPRNRKLWRE